MQVITEVLDALSDGTITRLTFRAESIGVTIYRSEPDQNFIIEKIDAVDQSRMEEALEALADHLHEHCIYSIDVNCVDGSKATLSI